ncbi:hypothetical protein CALVIDRAFT_535471 [Calocera viscosa TUFC12733]|uniref:Uncharacterized protein n=1 Tax=Calocera viscosa (strain TUFC12733) TaxID=1330018 RepID=A0A167P3K4_CALVF|nr:hypothetical protein CALVIDRAFT_535471 [Calocera viscosa TUFC12733]
MADNDPRFARLKTDPRFRRLHKKESKVIVDPRFKSLLQQGSLDQAQAGPSVDKYGRRQKTTQAQDQLRRFYRLDDDENETTTAALDLARGAVLMESSDEEGAEDKLGEESDEEEIVLERKVGVSKRTSVPDLAEIDLDEVVFPELEAQAAAYSAARAESPRNTLSGEETYRLAVVNLDWDNVQASDLYKVFASVGNAQTSEANATAESKILSVRVYPSEFGKDRLRQEETQGPPSEVFGQQQPGSMPSDNNIVEVDNGEDYDNNALRKYQLDRLRYYYAVVTCDSPATASYIYHELDGTELERTANVLDLRYVPDEMKFDEQYREEATEDDGLTRVLDFSTTALRHSKVKLTWDEDDPKRNRLTRRSLTRKEIDETDFKAYIASSESEEDGANTTSRRDKLRSLLLGDPDEQTTQSWTLEAKGKADMEVTFMPGLTAAAGDQDSDVDVTTLDRYQRKQRQKQKERRAAKGGPPGENEVLPAGDDFFEIGPANHSDATKLRSDLASKEELALILNADSQDEARHFDMQAVLRAEKAKSKKRPREERKGIEDAQRDNFVLDVADPRFNSLHDDTAFALDPSHPKFKKTKGMSSLLEERSMRRTTQLHPLGPPTRARKETVPEVEEGRGRAKKRRRT